MPTAWKQTNRTGLIICYAVARECITAADFQMSASLNGLKIDPAVQESAWLHISSLIVFFLQEIGQFADAIVDTFEFGMGVLHGHAEVGVTHGLLDDGDGDTLLGEDRGVGVPQSVNIDDPVHGVTLVNPGKRQVAVQDSIEDRRDQVINTAFETHGCVTEAGRCPGLKEWVAVSCHWLFVLSRD